MIRRSVKGSQRQSFLLRLGFFFLIFITTVILDSVSVQSP